MSEGNCPVENRTFSCRMVKSMDESLINFVSLLRLLTLVDPEICRPIRNKPKVHDSGL